MTFRQHQGHVLFDVDCYGSFAIPRAFYKKSNFRRENLGKKVHRFASETPWNDEFFESRFSIVISFSERLQVYHHVPLFSQK